MLQPRWMRHLRRALAAPGNLVAASGAIALAAITWNPLPLIFYGLGEPVWLYHAARGARYERELAEEDRDRVTGALERQLDALVRGTPCGAWIRGGHLPGYPIAYLRLVELRAQIARIVEARDGVARPLEDDIIARLDDMLRAYLALARERLLFHCALAKIYPQLTPEQLREPTLPWCENTRFVPLEQALQDVRARAERLRAELAQRPELGEVYEPVIETLERRCEELEARGRADREMAAQLTVFPDQFELIASKLAQAPACAGEIAEDMKLLLEQTDDTVRFAEDLRGSAPLYELGA
jgi:hypothetical protein